MDENLDHNADPKPGNLNGQDLSNDDNQNQANQGVQGINFKGRQDANYVQEAPRDQDMLDENEPFSDSKYQGTESQKSHTS